MKNMLRTDNKGVALIIVVGIVAMLAITATSFALQMIAEHKSAANAKNNVKTRYLAEMGINRAVGELLYGPGGAIQSAADYPTEAWYSGYIESSLLNNQGSYNVNIIDCNRQIYINDTNPTLLTNLNALTGSLLTAGDIAQISLPANHPFATKEQVINVLTGIPSQRRDKYNAIKDYITAYAFVDNDVVNPATLAAAPRAPINVNTASRQVLIAVLSGISDGTNSISSTEAASLADYLIAGRLPANGGPYTTYDGLWTRLLNAQGASVIQLGDAAIVMANANPNTDLLRFNPNYSWRRKHISNYNTSSTPYNGIDKKNLTVYTTEFCFNSGGYYELTSTGAMRDSAGNQTASKRLQAVVKLFDQWRQTTQAQFEASSLTASVKSHVQTYPEYDPASCNPLPPSPPNIPPATYDGQIMLATLTEPSGTPFLVNYNREDKDRLLNDLNADSGQVFTKAYWGPPQPDPNEASVIAANPGNLYPDGLYAGEGATYDCAYTAAGAASESVGTAEMWVKPNWTPYGYASVGAWNCPRFLAITDSWNFYFAAIEFEFWRTDPLSKQHLVSKTFTGLNALPPDYNTKGLNDWQSHAGWYYYCVWSQQFVALPFLDDPRWGPGAWHHIAISWRYWDQGTPNPQGEQRIYCDGVLFNQLACYPRGPQSSFSGPGGYIQVGGDAWSNVEAYSTIASVKIFNYARTLAEIQADYARGMYYNAGDASFESSSNNIGSARLCNIYWTEHFPPTSFVPSADIRLDVFDGSNWIGNYASRSNPAGNPLGVMTAGAGAIKYKAYFVTTGTGLRDTPLLDDVTITYTSGVQILYLREA